MPKAETVDKFFDAVNEAYDALLDAVKAGNERGYRVSRRLIDEVERGQREALDLTRRLALAPRDIPGFSTAAIRTVTDAQGRVLDLTRQLLDEVTDTQREGRDMLRKVIEANRGAGQAAIEATRETVTRAGTVVQTGVNGVRAQTSARRGARKTRTPSQTSS
jgi:hypothetical protein